MVCGLGRLEYELELLGENIEVFLECPIEDLFRTFFFFSFFFLLERPKDFRTRFRGVTFFL